MIPTYLVNPSVGAREVGFSYALCMENFATRLREARIAKGLTQHQVADFFGIKRVSVTQWESETTHPASNRLAALADLYGVDLDWLLNGKGANPTVSAPTDEDAADAAALLEEFLLLSPADRAYIRGRIDERKERGR